MEFSDFVQIIGKRLSNQTNRGYKCIDVVSMFLKNDFFELFYEKSSIKKEAQVAKYFSQFYSGARSLPNNWAQKFLKYYDDRSFCKIIRQVSSEAKKCIVNDFKELGYRVGDKLMDEKIAGIYKEILKLQIKKNISKNNQKETKGNVVENKEYSLEAKAFCLEYDGPEDYIVLCEIAAKMHPYTKSNNSLYNKYKMLTKTQQKEVFRIKKLKQIDFDPNRVDECLEKYEKDIERFRFSSHKFLYDGAKYFHRAFEYYKSNQLSDYDERIYKKHLKLFDMDEYLDIGSYINDYLDKNPNTTKPPMDFMWDYCNLGSCEDDEMVFYVNYFMEYSLIVIGNLTKPEDFGYDNYLEDCWFETFEDRYYYILYLLSVIYCK